MRESGKLVPVIFLTASGEEANVIRGLYKSGRIYKFCLNQPNRRQVNRSSATALIPPRLPISSYNPHFPYSKL